MKNPLRPLYDWTISWSRTPHAERALGGIALAESSFFPIPPDVLLIPMCVADSRRALRYAAVCTVGSVLGGVIGYAIGALAWAAVGEWFFAYVPGFTPERFDLVGGYYRENAFWAILAAAFTPIPYKVFTVAAGVFGVGLPVLVAASLLGRGGRFFAVAGCLRLFGPAVREAIERWFDLFTIVFLVLLIGGFLVLGGL